MAKTLRERLEEGGILGRRFKPSSGRYIKIDIYDSVLYGSHSPWSNQFMWKVKEYTPTAVTYRGFIEANALGADDSKVKKIRFRNLQACFDDLEIEEPIDSNHTSKE